MVLAFTLQATEQRVSRCTLDAAYAPDEGRISLSLVSDGDVYSSALWQMILSAGRAALMSMLRDPGRSTRTSSSSEDLKYVQE